LFTPERSTRYEIGAKTFFLDSSVSTTLAWYHLTRENLLTVDPLNPLFRIQTGKQRS
jgi:iron complex outermembrane receptor protein